MGIGDRYRDNYGNLFTIYGFAKDRDSLADVVIYALVDSQNVAYGDKFTELLSNFAKRELTLEN
jgi:hypothetical protein